MALKSYVFCEIKIVTSNGGGGGVRASVTKLYTGGRGTKVENRPKNCHVLFEWPLNEACEINHPLTQGSQTQSVSWATLKNEDKISS